MCKEGICLLAHCLVEIELFRFVSFSYSYLFCMCFSFAIFFFDLAVCFICFVVSHAINAGGRLTRWHLAQLEYVLSALGERPYRTMANRSSDRRL